jgi:two-component system, response regulator RegA
MMDAPENQRSGPTPRPLAKSLMIVEDDESMMQSLACAMEAQGFRVITANSVADAFGQIQLSVPGYAVVDMRLHDGCGGLDVISLLKQQRPDARAIILTGYGNIATVVKAVKLGAVDYLLKPADADDIISALLAPRGGIAKAPSRPMSADRVRWEHIHRVYEVCGRNVSETARRLNMHRRTLQRILTRRAGLLERASTAGS